MTTKPVTPESIETLMAKGTALTDEIADHDAAIAATQKTRAEKMKQLRTIKTKIVTLQLQEKK